MAKKGGYWVPADIEDKEIKYSYEPHSPKMIKGIPWPCCKYCGLVYLKNSISRWCIKMGCNSDYHPKFKHMLKR